MESVPMDQTAFNELLSSVVMTLSEVDKGMKVPGGSIDDSLGDGVNALDSPIQDGSRKISMQANIGGGSSTHPLDSQAFHCPVVPCTLPLTNNVLSPSIVSTNISTSSEGIRYALRSREISVEGSGRKGLPKLSMRVAGKGRGRKSYLSKAQDREKVDLGMGTQSSIEWALRAANAQAGSPI